MHKQLILFAFSLILNVNSANLLAQSKPDASNSSFAEQQFFTAVRQNNANEVAARLNKGWSVNALDSKAPHNSALHWAIWENATLAMSELLKQKDIELDRLNGVNESPLMIAALKGNVDIAKTLLAAGAYPNKEGWTPLHYAATYGHVAMIRLLLDAHAYIDAESPNKTTPLMMAARSKNILAVKLLLDEGADMGLKNDEGWTVQTFAEKADAVDIAEGLKLRVEALKARASKPAWMR
jgi:uncharacterized protein